MIRPRIGNFTYSEDEVTVMENDILSIKEEGVAGFVFGCLTPGREIDFTSMIK
jgi:copper homeostasis protein